MIYNVKVTKKAKADLLRTVKYISEKLHNPKAANELLDEAEKEIAGLSESPESYPLVHDELLSSKGVRRTFVKNYTIFYKIYEKSEKVSVLRFLYSRSDWAAILKR